MEGKGFDANDSISFEEAYASLTRDFDSITSGNSTLKQIKEDVLSRQIPDLKNFANGLGACAYSIFDFEDQKFLHMDDEIEVVTGIPKETYLKKGIKQIFSMVAYDNIPALISSTFHQRKFYAKLNSNEYDDYIFNREYAVRTKTSKKWILQQSIKTLVNNEGSIFANVYAETNIDHLKLDDKFRYYIYDRKLNKIIYPEKREVEDSKLDSLSDREREIIELLKEGYSNQEAADKLFISYHTVRTHRKNIFKKLECNNIVDLLQRLS